MGHPDFRVGGKIFATLHGAGEGSGTVMLLPEQQELAIEAEPEAFKPAAGAWGRGGSTVVALSRGLGRMAGERRGARMGLAEAGAELIAGLTPLPSSAIVASTIGLSARGVELVADQRFGGGGRGGRRPWRGPRRGRRARRRRSCPRPCGRGARPERRRRSRPGGRCPPPRRGRARSWSRPRRRPGRPSPHIRP